MFRTEAVKKNEAKYFMPGTHFWEVLSFSVLLNERERMHQNCCGVHTFLNMLKLYDICTKCVNRTSDKEVNTVPSRLYFFAKTYKEFFLWNLILRFYTKSFWTLFILVLTCSLRLLYMKRKSYNTRFSRIGFCGLSRHSKNVEVISVHN
jgi:hypothetical protein